MAWTVSNSECDFLRGSDGQKTAAAQACAFHSAPGAARRKSLANDAGLDDNRVMHTSEPSSPAQRGFTLVELMVTLAVMAILIALALPSFRDVAMNLRMSGLVSDLMADLALARSEAIKRNLTVMICPAAAPHAICGGQDFKVGWMVFVDANNNGVFDTTVGEQSIKRHRPGPTEPTFTITVANLPTGTPGTTAYVRYRPTGVSLTTAAIQTITLCDGRGATNPLEYRNTGRVISISPTGRAIVGRVTC